MDPVAWQRRGLGLDPMPAPALWPQARARLERLDAAGDASLADARIEMEGDAFSTEMKADGSAVTALRGPKKRILLKERGGLSLGAFAGGKRGEGAGGPVEVTAMDDIRIERGPDGPNGEPGPAAASLARWVRVREGARELTADALALTLQPSKEGGAGYVPGRLEARGNVRLKDGARGAQADEADWDAAADRVELRASTAAEAYDGETRLRAPRIAFDNRAGTLACDAPVAAQGVGGAMAPGEVLGGEKAEKKGEDREWKLTCGAMTGRLENGEMRELNAAGPVEIVTGDSHTTADRLEFDGRRVRLHGRPLRMTAGADVVEAAFADIHSRDGAAVLRGVKEIRLNVKGGMDSLVGLAPSASAEGAPDSPIFLTCRGPVTFDRARGLFTARDEVLVRAPEAPNDPSRKPGESRLEAERLFLFLDPATRKLAAAEAWGRVVLRSRDAVGKGDRLLYDVPSGTASFTGTGKPLLWKDGSAMRVDEILISDGGKTIKFLARHSAGSISFPDKGGGGAQGRNFMRDPFGGLMPEKKIVPNGKDRK
jgi:lipopolysaccharide export system protein LptA